MIAPVCQSAPAKLNLTLTILGRRTDGFHELVSLVAFARDVADTVTLTSGQQGSVTFSGPFGSDLYASETNTVLQTLSLVAQQGGSSLGALQQCNVLVDKNIPLASGLGGGSADAAAVIRAVKEVFPKAGKTINWLALARQIGADVPVCLASSVQMMSGVGETLQPVAMFPKLFAVMIKTDTSALSNKTQRVFETLDAKPIHEDEQRERDSNFEFSCTEDVAAFVRQTGNSLLEPARTLMPTLDAPLAALESSPGCLAASLSGAGPTIFGLFADKTSAETAARAIQTAKQAWWVRASGLV